MELMHDIELKNEVIDECCDEKEIKNGSGLGENGYVKNIDNSIVKLRRKFLKIRSMEYVKSVRNGNTGVGATFEALLGKDEDTLEKPDFEGSL